MHSITFRNQINMTVDPTENEHLITKQYLDNKLKDYAPQSNIIILDENNNEIPIKDNIKIIGADITSDDVNIIIDIKDDKILVDPDNIEFMPKKYIKFTNATITEENNTTIIKVNEPEINLSSIQKTFEFNGDGIVKEVTFDHNFDTKNVGYSFYNYSTGEDIPVKFIRLNTNQIKIISNEPFIANNSYVITISKLDKDITVIEPTEPTEYFTYGVRIDTTDSNPETSVVYMDDCLTSVPENFGERPCVLKDGVVQYYLNPNDFTKREDGSVANISGTDGDVMIEIPKMAYLIKTVGNYIDVKVTNNPDAKKVNPDYCFYAHTLDTEGDLDKIYIGAYLGATVGGKLRSISNVVSTASQTIGTFRTQAKANGNGYDQISFYPLTLLQCMYLVKYKNLDSQTALGRGFVDSSGYKNTGGTNTTGMYYGSTSGAIQMKFAGLEDFWGNRLMWIDGIVTNANREVLTSFKDFNDSGSGYVNKGHSLSSNIGGYCKTVIGDNDCGFVVSAVGGSTTTYYCDYGYRYASRVACFGGFSGYGSYSGAFCLRLADTASSAYPFIGARLMFRSLGK